MKVRLQKYKRNLVSVYRVCNVMCYYSWLRINIETRVGSECKVSGIETRIVCGARDLFRLFSDHLLPHLSLDNLKLGVMRFLSFRLLVSSLSRRLRFIFICFFFFGEPQNQSISCIVSEFYTRLINQNILFENSRSIIYLILFGKVKTDSLIFWICVKKSEIMLTISRNFVICNLLRECFIWRWVCHFKLYINCSFN